MMHSKVPNQISQEVIVVKRIKKPAVKPEVRRQWLRRYEEDGESPPQIARADNYDVRTVRKQIEVERQEREIREARSVVLRHALEQHYSDLCNFAQRLDLQLATKGGTLANLRDDRMWSALREHLPRSIIWKNLDRWEHLQGEITQLGRDVEDLIEEQIKSKSAFEFTKSSQELGFNKGTISAIASHFNATAKGEPNHVNGADFTLAPVDEELTDVEFNLYRIGRFPNQRVPDIQEMMSNLFDWVTTWEEHSKMSRLLAELERVQRVLHDELAVIILRRVVPGRCKYCPI